MLPARCETRDHSQPGTLLVANLLVNSPDAGSKGRGEKMRDRVYRTIVRIGRACFWLLAIRFDIRGQEHLSTSGAAVVASNHISYLDFAFVELVGDDRGRMIRFLAKGSLFRLPVVGRLMVAMGHIPVHRAAGAGADAYRQAERALERGEVVGVFPEATISRAWTLKSFKRGAAALAVRYQVPLIPVITWGGHRLITVDRRYSLRRHVPVVVVVGEPIRPQPGQSIDDVNALLRERMADMLDEVQREYPDRPAGPRDAWWLPRRLGGTAPDPAEAAVIDSAKVRS